MCFKIQVSAQGEKNKKEIYIHTKNNLSLGVKLMTQSTR